MIQTQGLGQVLTASYGRRPNRNQSKIQSYQLNTSIKTTFVTIHIHYQSMALHVPLQSNGTIKFKETHYKFTDLFTKHNKNPIKSYFKNQNPFYSKW